jgi:hypothetical protein
VPRFFFDIDDGVSLPDVVGRDLDDVEAACREARRLCGDALLDGAAAPCDGAPWRL